MFIGIFCSANANIPDLYFEETKRLGRWIGENGHSLVWGGCSLGLMETVGRSFLEGRSLRTDGSEGSLIGVVPSIIEERGKVFSPMDRTIRCSNLSQRKDMIVENSDVLIALPGGIGTLDEIFTVVSSSTIGYHSKKMLIYDVGGFWQPLKNLMDHLEKEGMIRGDYRSRIVFCSSLDEIKRMF